MPDPNAHLPLLRVEFPDFDTPVPEVLTRQWGFEDASWQNDTSPCFICDVFILWVDYTDKTKRQDGFQGRGLYTMTDEGRTVLETDDWGDIRAYVEEGRRDFWPYPMRGLVQEFQAFQSAHGFIDKDGDAHELQMGDLTPVQREWLSDFCGRWDAAQEAADRETSLHLRVEATQLALLATSTSSEPQQ